MWCTRSVLLLIKENRGWNSIRINTISISTVSNQCLFCLYLSPSSTISQQPIAFFLSLFFKFSNLEISNTYRIFVNKFLRAMEHSLISQFLWIHLHLKITWFFLLMKELTNPSFSAIRKEPNHANLHETWQLNWLALYGRCASVSSFLPGPQLGHT